MRLFPKVPKVGIIIPAYNEAKVIARSITSLIEAGIPGSDIYVVDDGSKDKTTQIGWDLKVNVLTIQNVGKSMAIKRALNHYKLFDRYEWLTILDADSYVAPDYFVGIQEAIDKHPEASLVFASQHSQKGNWITAFRAFEYRLCCEVYREAQHISGSVVVAPGFASTYRSSVMKHLDFDAGTLVEDMDMTIQLHREGRGGEIVYAPNAHVYTQDPHNLRDFWGQTMRWSRGTWQVIKLRRLGLGMQKVDFEAILTIGENLLFGFALTTLPIWLWMYPLYTAGIFAASILLDLTYAVLIARSEKRWDILRAFPAFPFLRILSSVVFITSFFAELRPSHIGWYKAERREI